MEVIYSGHASVQILLLWLIYFLFFFLMFLSIKSQKKIMKNTHQSSLDCQKIWQPRLLISHFLLLFYFLGGVVVQSLKVRNITNSFQLSIIHLVAVLTFTKIWAVVALICMCFCLMSVFVFSSFKIISVDVMLCCTLSLSPRISQTSP